MSDVSFRKLCGVLEEVSKTRKRLEIQNILSEYFQNIKKCPETLVAACYLCTCTFCPEFYGLELGIGEAVILKLVCEITGKKSTSVREIVRKTGDLAQTAVKNRRRTLIPQKMDHSVISVRKHLQNIASITGQNSLTAKIRLMCEFCMRCNDIELKYMIRMYESKLKIGLALKTVLISLSLAFYPKDACFFEKIKGAYNRCPIFEEIIEKLCSGEDLSESIRIRPGVPVKPMLAQASKNLTAAFKKVENCEFICEYKYDGERAQIHFYTDSSDRKNNRPGFNELKTQESYSGSNHRKAQSNNILAFSIKSNTTQVNRETKLIVDRKKNDMFSKFCSHPAQNKETPLPSTKNSSVCHFTHDSQILDAKKAIKTCSNLKGPFGMQHILSANDGNENFSIDSTNKRFKPPINIQQESCIEEKNETDNLNLESHRVDKTNSLLPEPQSRINYKIFSRNSEDITVKYPDLTDVIKQMCSDGNSFILDGEIVAYDRQNNKILPFQLLTTRKRKNVQVKDITFDVCIFVFDCLYFDGVSLLEQPFSRRREVLLKNFNLKAGFFDIVNYKKCTMAEQIDDFFNEAISKNAEGIMVKNIQGLYKPSLRSTSWIKLKKDYLEGMADSFDLVVIGAYYGKGKRTGSYGGFLLACYNEADDLYEAICKIGTGFDDESLTRFYSLFSKEKLNPEDKQKYNIVSSDSVNPDVWLTPRVVWEVKAAGLSLSPIYSAASKIASCGLSLRFPRFIRERHDKNSIDATTSEQIYSIFNDCEIKEENPSDDFD